MHDDGFGNHVVPCHFSVLLCSHRTVMEQESKLNGGREQASQELGHEEEEEEEVETEFEGAHEARNAYLHGTALTTSDKKGTGKNTAINKRARVSKKPQRIKRPMNAFMVWSSLERKKLAEREPQLHNTELSKRLGEMWKGMNEEAKKPYREEADRLKAKLMEEHPDYKYRPRRRKIDLHRMRGPGCLFAPSPSQLLIQTQGACNSELFPMSPHNAAVVQGTPLALNYQQNLASPTDRAFSVHNDKNNYIYPYAYMQSLSQSQLQMHRAAYPAPYASTQMYAAPFSHYVVNSTASPGTETSIQPSNGYTAFSYQLASQVFSSEEGGSGCGENGVADSMPRSADDIVNDNHSPSVISEDSKFSYQSGDRSHTTVGVEYSPIQTSTCVPGGDAVDCSGAPIPYNNNAPTPVLSASQCPAPSYEHCPPTAPESYPSVMETPPCSPYMPSTPVQTYCSSVPLTPTATQVSAESLFCIN